MVGDDYNIPRLALLQRVRLKFRSVQQLSGLTLAWTEAPSDPYCGSDTNSTQFWAGAVPTRMRPGISDLDSTKLWGPACYFEPGCYSA